MRAYEFAAFGLEHLKLVERDPPQPGPDEVVVDVQYVSLNYRDLLVITGRYNPKLRLPQVPLSDGAGVISAVGANVTRVRVGDRVTSHFVSGWIDGPFVQAHLGTTLGAPRAGLAAQQVKLPADAVIPVPRGYDLAQAATLPIAALTAWSALRTVSDLQSGQTVLTLGTGGVSIFALQFAKAMGARVILTSSSDEKLARGRALGADETINYINTPQWDKAVLELTGGLGTDVVVENVGAGTLEQSLRATRAAGTVALLGALAGLKGEITAGTLLMKRLRLIGIMVGSRREFADMNVFIEQHRIEPVIDRRFAFEELPEALRYMESGRHFGKLVVET